MIVMARAGVPEEVIKTKLTVLSRMKYYVKMAFSISPNHFTHSFLCKVYGLLQGSANASSIWSLNWSILFDALDKQFPKA